MCSCRTMCEPAISASGRRVANAGAIMDLSFVAVGTIRRWTNFPKQNPAAAAIRHFQSGKFTSGYFKHRSWKYSAIIDAIGRRANQQMVAQSKAHRRRNCAHLDRTEAEHGPLARPIGGKAP